MKKIALLYISIIFLTACNPGKYIYFKEDKIPVADSSFYLLHKTNYQLQPGDVLYFSVYSTLSESENIFHFPSQSNAGNLGSSNMYLTQYVINDSGYVRIPVIGTVYAAGVTINELQKALEIDARKYISDAMVLLKLVSFQITFLGEFTRTGKITFYKDRIHILDALGEVGDVTFNGDRKHVRIMRQTPDGIFTYRIDLTDKNLMTSEKFYLQPNDVVYAEPIARKIVRTNISDYALILTTISSTLAFITLMVSLQNK
jgi:polysaccharide biosynthesis/export protein